MRFRIVKNEQRYPRIEPSMPSSFWVEGCTLEQARVIAERLTNYHAGCDFAYYVEGDPENE